MMMMMMMMIDFVDDGGSFNRSIRQLLSASARHFYCVEKPSVSVPAANDLHGHTQTRI